MYRTSTTTILIQFYTIVNLRKLGLMHEDVVSADKAFYNTCLNFARIVHLVFELPAFSMKQCHYIIIL